MAQIPVIQQPPQEAPSPASSSQFICSDSVIDPALRGDSTSTSFGPVPATPISTATSFTQMQLPPTPRSEPPSTPQGQVSTPPQDQSPFPPTPQIGPQFSTADPTSTSASTSSLTSPSTSTSALGATSGPEASKPAVRAPDWLQASTPQAPAWPPLPLGHDVGTGPGRIPAWTPPPVTKKTAAAALTSQGNTTKPKGGGTYRPSNNKTQRNVFGTWWASRAENKGKTSADLDTDFSALGAEWKNELTSIVTELKRDGTTLTLTRAADNFGKVYIGAEKNHQTYLRQREAQFQSAGPSSIPNA
ncbi:hypothetical protein BKA70DRAFT_756398 [Coprinopsis sp. MPI-PUGE-AT-0042]|nr:hypothetical protein BKA70DRAFT_756398 [Coprinopsis sp. MPI-PUGE-AT-0042]